MKLCIGCEVRPAMTDFNKVPIPMPLCALCNMNMETLWKAMQEFSDTPLEVVSVEYKQRPE